MDYNEIISVAQVLIDFLPPIPSRRHQPVNILAGILQILVTGMQWRNLSQPFPPKSTCYYWFRKLSSSGAWKGVYEQFLWFYRENFRKNLETCVVDGTFVKATKGGDGIGRTKFGNGTKIIQIVDKYGLPQSIYLSSAAPHESQLLMDTISRMLTVESPKYLLADRAYDSDSLDTRCKEIGISLVAHNKINRKLKTQDGRQARRLQGRYVVERTNAHIKNYRRVAVRHERSLFLYGNFVWIAQSVIFIRKFSLHNEILAA